MSNQIGIIVAEAYPLVPRGLESILSQVEDIKWLAEATNVSQAIELAQSLKPDVLLLVPNLDDYDPVESILRIQSACPTVKVLMLSASTDSASVRTALNAGVAGYVLKSEPIETIVQAIRLVAQGVQWISPSLLARQQAANAKPNLSKREKKVLALLITGKTDRQIGDMLNVHERTVRHYLRQLYNKLGVETRVEAVAQAFRLELV